MAATGTTFPTTLDLFNNVVDDVDDILASPYNIRTSAIFAIETLLGITDSADTDSVTYKLNNIVLTDPTTTRGDILARDADNFR